jgi:hypothetical protein
MDIQDVFFILSILCIHVNSIFAMLAYGCAQNPYLF